MKRFLLILSLLVFVPLPLLTTGCASRTVDTSGAYAGDSFLYNSDASYRIAYTAISSFLKWELQNREALLAENPKIKAVADDLRRNGPKWSASYFALRDGYALSPTPDNRASVAAILSTIQSAVAAALPYLDAQVPAGSGTIPVKP